MNRLEGRVALVTGAASGIGKATAQRLSAEGAAVLVTDIQVDAGEATAKGLTHGGGRAAFIRHDVSSESEWEAACARAVDEFGSLDILVNNAGMGDIKPIEETTLDEWNRTVSIDQTGVGQLVQIAAQKGNQTRPGIKLGICGEHGGDPDSVKFCHKVGLTYVSCSPYRVPVARLAAAQAAVADLAKK